MEPPRALRRATKRGESVRLKRRGPDLSDLYGFPLAVGRSLVLMRNLEDFDVNGFTVLPLREVADVRSGESERFVERVLRDAGQLRKVVPPRFSLGLGKWEEVFSALGAAGEVVIVDCEVNPADNFRIGVVTGLTAGAVGIHQFDGMAVWDSAPTVVSYDEITRVRFEERYTRVFARYLTDPPGG